MKSPAHLIPFALAAAFFWAGCASGENGESITEKKRRALDPKVGQFLVEGQRAYERGAYGIALSMTDSAERYAPDLADLHFLRGLVYTQGNQLSVANAAYETVIELDPEYKGAYFNLGMVAFRQGRLRDALAIFRKEEALEPTSGLYLEVGRIYASLGEPDSARAAYEQSLALDSTNATALMWLGQLHDELGDVDEALEISKKGLQLRPQSLDYKYIVGSLLFRNGESEEAEEYLRPVAEQRPWHHGAQFNMGQVLMRLGEEEEAKAYFAQADSAQQLRQQINEANGEINREPEEMEHWIKLGTLLRKSGEYDKAIEAFNVASSMDPLNMHLQNNLSLLYMEKGDFETAIRRYRAIVSIDSTLTDVWLNLGAAYANAGDRKEAEAAWNKVLQLRPGHPAARDYLARLSEILDRDT